MLPVVVAHRLPEGREIARILEFFQGQQVVDANHDRSEAAVFRHTNSFAAVGRSPEDVGEVRTQLPSR